MSFNLKVLLLVLFVLTSVSTATFLINRKELGDEITPENYRKGEIRIVDQAIDQAKIEYDKARIAQIDLSSGPCLSNDLLKDWVADIVHNPRVEEDEEKENQCIAYLEGRAKHFVELDSEGNFIRAK